jgi:hypothetical protein
MQVITQPERSGPFLPISFFKEREKLTERDLAAARSPKKIMSISMDGKAPILIPHIPRLAKSLFLKYHIRQQLWGLVNFGRKEYEFFPYFDWWRHDPNLTLSFFWRHLSRTLSESTDSFDVLYINADNCARENKNRWMFPFLALLVHKKYFKSIELHFLMPGHSRY